MVASNNGIDNTIGASISGVTNTLTVTNPSNTASSAARETIVVGGGTAGDPTINWNVSGVTNWEMGIDNSVTDNLTISQGTALGTNDTWRMTTAGQRTLPLQSAFRAFVSVTQPNVTGDGTNYPIIWNTVVFDQSSNYNNATGVFTAPITGKYFFVANVFLSPMTAAHNSFDITFYINGVANARLKEAFIGPAAGGGLSYSAIIPLSATNQVNATVSMGGGTKTVGLLGSSLDSTFAGYLIL